MTAPDDDALTARLRAAFPAEADSRDQALAQLIAGAGPADAKVVALRLARPRAAAIWGGLIAASFVAGAVLGPMLGARSSDGFSVGPGAVITDGELVAVLDRRLAADGADEAGRAIGLTFRATDGQWCRTFEAGEAGVAGLACRAGQDWTLRALAPAPPTTARIRTAGAETPAAILAAVDETLSGETLDAAAEARARDAGWGP